MAMKGASPVPVATKSWVLQSSGRRVNKPFGGGPQAGGECSSRHAPDQELERLVAGRSRCRRVGPLDQAIVDAEPEGQVLPRPERRDLVVRTDREPRDVLGQIVTLDDRGVRRVAVPRPSQAASAAAASTASRSANGSTYQVASMSAKAAQAGGGDRRGRWRRWGRRSRTSRNRCGRRDRWTTCGRRRARRRCSRGDRRPRTFGLTGRCMARR
jgi:hypothetical protein